MRPMLTHVEPKDPKNGNRKKHRKTQGILKVGGLSWGYVGPSEAMLAYLEGNVGPSWGFVGPSWRYVGPSWGYVGPSWGYVGPSWGVYGGMLAHLEAMLAHLEAHAGPRRPTSSHKTRKWGKKIGKSTKHRKGRSTAAKAAAPLSYGEERTAVRQCHGHGGPGWIEGLPPLSPTP